MPLRATSSPPASGQVATARESVVCRTGRFGSVTVACTGTLDHVLLPPDSPWATAAFKTLLLGLLLGF